MGRGGGVSQWPGAVAQTSMQLYDLWCGEVWGAFPHDALQRDDFLDVAEKLGCCASSGANSLGRSTQQKQIRE